MAQHKPTPEEQLLKLIENPEAAKAKAAAAPSAGNVQVKTAKRSGVSLSKLAGIFDYWKHQIPKSDGKPAKGKESAHSAYYVKSFNLVLIAAILAAAIYLIMDLTILKDDQRLFLSSVSVQDSIYPIQEQVKSKARVPELEYYDELIKRRNPFALPSEAPVETAEPEDDETVAKPKQEEGPKNKAQERTEVLNLVGISWSETNPFAMIEDTKSGRTYFLRAGQDINGLKVQRIDKEKVVVTYEGEEALLF